MSFQVEVSSPSAELEKTICTNSLYGATMCSKISTSLYNSHKPNQKNLIGSGSSSSSGSGDDDEGTAEQGEGAVAAATITTIAAKNNELSQQQKQNSGDSGVQSSSPTASKTMMMMDSSGSVTSEWMISFVVVCRQRFLFFIHFQVPSRRWWCQIATTAATAAS